MAPTPEHERYWCKNLALTGGLLLIWLLVSFGVSYFARELDFRFFGWPFSFWVAAQGALIVYVAIVAVYAWCMHRLDVAHGVQEVED